MQNRQDAGELANETDAFVNSRTRLLVRLTCGQGVALWFGEDPFHHRCAPQADGRRVRACAVVEITSPRWCGVASQTYLTRWAAWCRRSIPPSGSCPRLPPFRLVRRILPAGRLRHPAGPRWRPRHIRRYVFEKVVWESRAAVSSRPMQGRATKQIPRHRVGPASRHAVTSSTVAVSKYAFVFHASQPGAACAATAAAASRPRHTPPRRLRLQVMTVLLKYPNLHRAYRTRSGSRSLPLPDAHLTHRLAPHR